MSKQEVTLMDYMGTDLSVVNAARVSFDKESHWAAVCCGKSFGMECCGDPERGLSEADASLISYLAKHNHWTPFAHTAITLRIKAPIFVRTQCFKHKAGFVENEVSRRYVDSEPEFYVPDEWRRRPEGSVKQGSGSGIYSSYPQYEGACHKAVEVYNGMVKQGIAPEQARMVLPQSMMTEWVWTGNLASYARFYNQRTAPHAQQEIRDLAQQVSDIISPIFPVSWAALTEEPK